MNRRIELGLLLRGTFWGALALSACDGGEGATADGGTGGGGGAVADTGAAGGGGAPRDAGPHGDLAPRPDRGLVDLGAGGQIADLGAGGQIADLGAGGQSADLGSGGGGSGGGGSGGGGSGGGGSGGAEARFERFEIFSAAGPCPDDTDCSGQVVVQGDGHLTVDRFGELPVVVHEAQVPPDLLEAAILVLTDPALVALLDLPGPPCQPPFDIFERMSLTLGGTVHENDTTFCEDPPLVAARDTMFALMNALVPPGEACVDNRDCVADASCPAIGGCDLDQCTVDACNAGHCGQGYAPECTACADTCEPDGNAPPPVCDCAKFGDDPAGLAAFDFVEFCVPNQGDAEAQAAALLPGLQCSGSRGRIGCDPATQRLCLWEPPREARQGPLPCGAWDTLCRASRLGSIREIRGSFFE